MHCCLHPQGCGHIRYMMTYPDQYDLKNPGEVSTLPWAIKAFYRCASTCDAVLVCVRWP